MDTGWKRTAASVVPIGLISVVTACTDPAPVAGPPGDEPGLEPQAVLVEAGTVVQVSNWGVHTCVLRVDGTVACWGWDGTGSATPPAATFTQISAGMHYTCGVTTAQTVECWGHAYTSVQYGEASPPAGAFTEVSAAYNHTCGIRTDGTVACWGRDDSGQASPPAGVFAQVAAGGSHTCGLRPDGSVDCWGDNTYGQLSPPAGTFTQISAGINGTCGVRDDRTAACWGARWSGGPMYTPPGHFSQVSLGYGDRICTIEAEPWAGYASCSPSNTYWQAPGKFYTQISTGNVHACGVTADRDVFCWGQSPVGADQIPDQTFTEISQGATHTCGILQDGRINCWGGNNYGKSTPPTGTFTRVSAGANHTCGIASAGTGSCWGLSSGFGSVPTGTVIDVSTGWHHTCWVRADHTVICGGDPDFGQSIAPAGSFTQVSAGYDHTCGLAMDGTVVCWGDNADGQSTPPGGSFMQVSAGYWHTCGLRGDGTIECWGQDGYGQVSPPTGTFTQVSAGRYHTCAITDNGTVTCWGDDTYGKATPPPGKFTQVSAGYINTCGLEEDQSMACWGSHSIAETSTNLPPEAHAAAQPSSITEGDAVTLDATGSIDPNGDPLTYAWDFGDGSSASGATVSHTYLDDGEYTAVLVVTDPYHLSASASVTVTVTNAAPTIGTMTGPPDPVTVGTIMWISGLFTDPGPLDTHTGQTDWGDNTTDSPTITGSSGTWGLTATHIYTVPGVYAPTIEVRDDDGGSDTLLYQYIVVYDPRDGFVAGGGIIDSPAGAFVADPTAAGLATFGFQSRYARGAVSPSGNTQFRFHAAQFVFRSTSYQWLVIAGPTAKYKGEGTVNGVEGYGFMITARDGQAPGGGDEDQFRLKVWELATGLIVYDNQPGATDDSDAATPLRGGQIRIQP
jgi:alpha-tubulin suppressor-like RCC1 family protein